MRDSQYIIIDSRMREIEKEYLASLSLQPIEIPQNIRVYPEISSHVDIFCTRVQEMVIAEPTVYPILSDYPFPCICGRDSVTTPYPKDILYNVCMLGKYAIHHFAYTDLVVKEWIEKTETTKIGIKQGYSKCSIAVIDDNSCIVSDESIARKLRRYGIAVLVVPVDHVDIKLWRGDTYSTMCGLIGGNITRVRDQVIVWGDISHYPDALKIQAFVEERNLKMVHFAGLDLIDYGSVVEI